MSRKKENFIFFFKKDCITFFPPFSILFYPSHSHPDSPHSHSYSPHSHPDSLRFNPDSPHSHPITTFPAFPSLFPAFPPHSPVLVIDSFLHGQFLIDRFHTPFRFIAIKMEGEYCYTSGKIFQLKF